MRATHLLAPLAIIVLPAQSPPVGTVEVAPSSVAFAPSTIRLRAGEPVVLRLTTGGRGRHNFSAPEFFAAAGASGAPQRDGPIEGPARRTVEIRLVPRSGSYRLRCTHTLHGASGMRGEIVVEQAPVTSIPGHATGLAATPSRGL